MCVDVIVKLTSDVIYKKTKRSNSYFIRAKKIKPRKPKFFFHDIINNPHHRRDYAEHRTAVSSLSILSTLIVFGGCNYDRNSLRTNTPIMQQHVCLTTDSRIIFYVRWKRFNTAGGKTELDDCTNLFFVCFRCWRRRIIIGFRLWFASSVTNRGL